MGQPARASRLLAHSDTVVVRFPEHEPPRTLQPAAIPLDVLFEDEHLAVIDKPAGLVVHPAPGHWNDTLVNALVARGTTLSGGAEGRPGIVHRLDRDTSGLMVVAKTDLAHRRLGAAIAARRVQRSYAALAWGHLDESPTVIDAPLARHPQDRKRMTVIATGRPSRTDALRRRPVRRGESCCGWSCTAAAPIRSGFIWNTSATRSWAIRSTPGAEAGESPARSAGRRRRSSGPRRGRLFTQRFWHSATPPRGRRSNSASEWPADLRAALVAAGGEDLVARPDPLSYLLFFNRDG